jgi:hypothetical protein
MTASACATERKPLSARGTGPGHHHHATGGIDMARTVEQLGAELDDLKHQLAPVLREEGLRRAVAMRSGAPSLNDLLTGNNDDTFPPMNGDTPEATRSRVVVSRAGETQASVVTGKLDPTDAEAAVTLHVDPGLPKAEAMRLIAEAVEQFNTSFDDVAGSIGFRRND